jgi:acyl-CoA thioesterase
MQKLPIELIRNIIATDNNAVDTLHKAFYEISPAYRLMKLRLTHISEGYAKAEFPYIEELSRVGGMLHGGAIVMAIDQIAGTAALTVNKGVNQVTIELKINFLKPLTRGDEPFTVEGKVIRAGKTTIVCEGKIYNSKGDICAIGIGTWYVFY